jgi:hypothetical protein
MPCLFHDLHDLRDNVSVARIAVRSSRWSVLNGCSDPKIFSQAISAGRTTGQPNAQTM